MHEAFTPEWTRAFRAAIDASADYRAAARRWAWPTSLVVEAAPAAGIDSDRAIYLDLDHGSCRAARTGSPDDFDAEFELRGSYEAWRAIVEGRTDPMAALLKGRLRLTRGSMARLALHAGAARALALCATHVPTRFHDDPPHLTTGSAPAPPRSSATPGHRAPGEAHETASDPAGDPTIDPADPTAPSRHGQRAPEAGAETLDHDATFRRLFRNAERLPWEADAVDLSRDRDDWERIRRDYAEERYAEQLHRLCSLFHEGEESVARTLSPFLGAVSRAGLGTGPELHLAAQVYEEARHFAFFERYFREVLGDSDTDRHMAPAPQAVLVDDLDEVARRIRREEDPAALRRLLVEGVTHYMGVVEAMLARTGYRGAGQALTERGWLPGLQEGFRLIRRDEGRHVAFGIHFIAASVARDPSLARVVEETFERHLPNVLATVAAFDFPHALVDVTDLQEYALGAYRQFMAAAGLDEGVAGDLEAELASA